MDRRLFSALAGLIPAGFYALAQADGEFLLPAVGAVAALAVAGGLHVAWRAQA